MSVLTDNDILELMHSAKGTTWANHKYIAIKNGRYIYPDSDGGGNSKKGALDADLFRSRIWRRHKARQLAKNKQKYNAYDYNIVKKHSNKKSKTKESGKSKKESKEDKKAKKEALKVAKEKEAIRQKMEAISNTLEIVLNKMDTNTINKLNMDDESNVKYLISTYLNVNPETLPKDQVSSITSKIKTKYFKHVGFINFSEDYLSHFGILGMKWGRKNGPPYPLDSSISTGKRLKKKRIKKQEENRLKNIKKKNKIVKKIRKLDELNRSNISDQELKAKVQRLKLEKELKDLTSDRYGGEKGRKIIKYAGRKADSILDSILKSEANSLWKKITRKKG